MKKIFKIFNIESKEVCIPSSDYYAKGNDWQTETIEYLTYINQFDSEEEALIFMENSSNFTILPFYIKQ